ncbi:MAG: cysteine hydrolase [Acidimicrobiales bacterium]
MPADLAALVDPAHTAIITLEMQRGVAGDLAILPELRNEMLANGAVDNLVSLVDAGRSTGVRIVHATAESRTDRTGQALNCRLLAATAGRDSFIATGSDEAQLIPELRGHESDVVLARLHGLTPFTSTSLDQLLRNMGIRTVVATGNSVNVGVLGLVLSAVDLGYQVVLPRDSVGGVPQAYADMVIDNTLALLATVTTAAELIETWSSGS